MVENVKTNGVDARCVMAGCLGFSLNECLGGAEGIHCPADDDDVGGASLTECESDGLADIATAACDDHGFAEGAEGGRPGRDGGVGGGVAGFGECWEGGHVCGDRKARFSRGAGDW